MRYTSGLLEESLEVVYRQSCLALAAMHSSCNASHARVIRFLVVVIVDHDRNPLTALLMPLLAALEFPLGISDGGIRWHHIATTCGCFPTAWYREKFNWLLPSGVLGGDATQLLRGVPKKIIRHS
jgi:hypothetical protein